MYDKVTVDYFLENQLKLFPENVADTYDEAEEFLEDVCAEVFDNKKDLIRYLRDEKDASSMSDDDILSLEEVFVIPDGRFLFVEG